MDLYDLLYKCNIHFEKQKVFNHIVNKIEHNSLEVCMNDIFVAIKGEDVDGHNFIEAAILKDAKTIIYEDQYFYYQTFENVNLIKVHDSKKALAILANFFFDSPSKQVNLVGVTGTNGKTTVTTMIYSLYQLMNIKATLIGTTGIKIDKLVVENRNTTPSNLILNKVMFQSLEKKIKNVVMEVSSHSIKQQRVAYLDFDTIIFTNFSHDHLDYHKTFDDYFYTKGLLFAHLGNYYNKKHVLINGDDKFYKKFIALTNVMYYTYGLGEENDFQARNITCDINKISFDFYSHNDFIGTVHTNNIFGFFNVYNLLAVISYFYIHKYDLNELFTKVKELNFVSGRMQKVETKYDISVFIDYAHTPDSVYRVLNEIKMITNKNLICIIGCGGNRDKLKRPIIGKIATNISDFVIFTSDNPRDEDPQAILNDIIKGACNNNYITIENRSKAIKYAIDTASINDVVVILGKGHENYQIIQDERLYFSDYEESEKYIEQRFLSKGETI